MAIKAGTENKRNVVIAGVLFCVLGYLVYSQLFSGPSTPPPATPSAPTAAQTTVRSAPAPQAAGTAHATTGGTASGPAARKVNGSNLDPSLHLERLALSESIEYAGSGRNIFSADSAPVMAIEQAAAPARPEVPVQQAYVPPPVPQPPAIDLKYFGYSAAKDGKREAFLLKGDDIFQAGPGDVVSHRYKVVSVDARSVQVTDLSYNNTQTLPLSAN